MTNCLSYEAQGTTWKCKECLPSYYLDKIKNECILSTIISCKTFESNQNIINPSKCIECSSGYFLHNNACIKNIKDCLESKVTVLEDYHSSDSIECLKCKSGYFISKFFTSLNQNPANNCFFKPFRKSVKLTEITKYIHVELENIHSNVSDSVNDGVSKILYLA